jgi:Retrotransposon gag protein/Zinc knuckle
MAQPNIETGRLRDPCPDFFNGDRTKSETFKRQFKLYQGLNANHEVMRTPYLRTMLMLTLIKGPLVEDWVADQVNELEAKVNDPANPRLPTDNTLWTEFITAFDNNFTDVTRKQQALSALYHLRMQKDRFDDYVAAFKHYAKQANFDLAHEATIRLFAMGIEDKLLDSILHRDNQPNTIPEYITAAQAEIQKYQNRQSIKNPGNAKFRWVGNQQMQYPRTYNVQERQLQYPQGRHRNDQIVPMDVDPPSFAQIRRADTDAQKQEHRAAGKCFRCSRQGHMARDCPTRKEQPFKPSFQHNRQPAFAPSKPHYQKKPYGQKRPQQGPRKFNKPYAFKYVQNARAANIEEMEEDEPEYATEEISELAARTSRLSEDERGMLLAKMTEANPDF